MGKSGAQVTKPLTQKQTKFVKEVAKGKSGTQAALAAYDVKNSDVARSMAAENLAKPSIREAIEKEMERQGITLELAIKPVAKALVAKKKEFIISKDGERVEIGKTDDIEMQLKGHDRAMKLMGANKGEDKPVNMFFGNSINIGEEFVK